MNISMVEQALRRLGQVLVYHMDIDILLVGGAAGMVTGVLPPSRTTTDCDVMVCVPSAALSAVELAAAQVADEFELAPRWFNSDVQLRLDALPDGWEGRKIHVGNHGRLRISAASRPDLIAMKVLAGRPQDIEDIHAMGVRIDEVGFIREYLDALLSKGTAPEQIADAREILDALEVHEDE